MCAGGLDIRYVMWYTFGRRPVPNCCSHRGFSKAGSRLEAETRVRKAVRRRTSQCTCLFPSNVQARDKSLVPAC